MLSERALERASVLFSDMKSADPFYKSRRWKLVRAAILRRDRYRCQWSLRYGKRVQADTVHHAFPRAEFPAYEFEAWNLVSLSGDVHDSMHDRITGALTERGRVLLRLTARRAGIEVPERYR